ncbi:MAG: hypothetical protein EPO55_04955 [Reyranella sp.]|uniref:hypothetical protein n=1 Tax=Reyranella sp. TaxID=1929291 RepID=UPI00121D3F0E|nr:hypothetical protein [Reyranella sp.]TAJ41609.1 MAG: hypothetical protein EPO55_04955 [Reyranella sp.]
MPQRPVLRFGRWCWPSAAATVAALAKASFVDVVASKKTVHKSIELSKQISGWRLPARQAFKV